MSFVKYEIESEQEKENLQNLISKVEKHFSLKKQSLQYFKDQVLCPDLAPEIYEIFKDSEDGRVRIELHQKDLEFLDSAWSDFVSIFRNFIEEYNVSYKDFSNNKIMIGKNEYKIKKALDYHYSNKKDKVISTFSQELKQNHCNNILPRLYTSFSIYFDLKEYISEEDFVELMKKVISNSFSKIEVEKNLNALGVLYEEFMSLIHPYYNKENCKSQYFKEISRIDFRDVLGRLYTNINFKSTYEIQLEVGIVPICSQIDEFISYGSNPHLAELFLLPFASNEQEIKLVDKVKEFDQNSTLQVSKFIASKWENISAKRLIKDSINMVLSINYADWFLCSTSENWSSCLNLNGDMNYWIGLPGLAGDKNRFMVYFTNNEKKSYYDIYADSIFFRSFVLLGDDDSFYSVRWYPYSNSNSDDLLQKKLREIGIHRTVKQQYAHNPGFRTKYPITQIFSEVGGFAFFPYVDYGRLYFNRQQNELHIEGSSGGCILVTYDSKDGLKRTDNFPEEFEDSSFPVNLNYLIDRDRNINDCYEEAENSDVCSECDCRVDNDDCNYNEDGNIICETCFNENYFFCQECGDTHHNDDLINTADDDCICERCYERHYFTCEFSERIYHIDDSVAVGDCLDDDTFLVYSNSKRLSREYGYHEGTGYYFPLTKLVFDEESETYMHVEEIEERKAI